MDDLDDIRQQVNPEDYVAGLRQNVAVYKRQLATVLAEMDLFAADETLDSATRAQITEPLKQNLRSLSWRIKDIEQRLKQTAVAAMGLSQRDGAKGE